jgi:hypothetical protein
VEKDAEDIRSPFDQVQELHKGEGGIPAVLLRSSVSEHFEPLSPRYTDGPEALQACVSSHLATDDLTLDWRVRQYSSTGHFYASCQCG